MLKRGRRLGVWLIAAGLATWVIWQLSLSHSGDEKPLAEQAEEYIALLEQYRSALRGIHESLDLEHAQRLLHTSPGALDPDPSHYATRLQGFVDDFFARSPFQEDLARAVLEATAPIPRALRRLDKRLLPRLSVPKRVFSFDKRGSEGVPREFIWEERLNPPGREREWVVEVGNDQQMDQWFDYIVAGRQEDGSHPGTVDINRREVDIRVDSRQGHPVKTATGADRWRRVWHGILENKMAGVLRSDLLRYLMILTRGGLYTDSDTAPLSHPDLWGTQAKDHLPTPLASVDRTAESWAVKQTPEPGRGAFRSSPEGPIGLLSPESPINLVVAVEYDLGHSEQDVREGYDRNLQIAQWTFMARTLHPVFIDVLETATRQLERMIGEDTMWQGIDVLGVTGPGAFTDAVFRYLLVRYGFNPLDLRNMQGGAIIGDVLVLPLHAFGLTVDPTEWGWNGSSAATRCVTHHFRSRWKG